MLWSIAVCLKVKVNVNVKVAPLELETLLMQHACVQDAAVIGVPDKQAGELPRAFIVKKPHSNVTETDIITFVQSECFLYFEEFKTSLLTLTCFVLIKST